jgi:SNF2 family DNA or RNA helicase
LCPPTRSPFCDQLESWHTSFVERQNDAHVAKLHQQRSVTEEKALANTMQLFPEVRLIEYDCGKLQMLAVMLRRLHAQKHRCLIFTQMSKMLDVLQLFLAHHQYTYFRLDGSTNIERRQMLMERFNSDSSIFCFILSTRAGGVGKFRLIMNYSTFEFRRQSNWSRHGDILRFR